MSETWIPAEQLRAEVMQMLADCTPGDWDACTAPHPDDDKTPAEWLASCLTGEGELWCVTAPNTTGDGFDYLVPAVTGDGPFSEAHAKLIAATPRILRLFLKLTEPRPFRVEVYERKRVDAGPDGAITVTRYHWRAVHASNGEIMASGEGYNDERDRDHAIDVLFPGVERVEVKS